jgi:hypothetical protein
MEISSVVHLYINKRLHTQATTRVPSHKRFPLRRNHYPPMGGTAGVVRVGSTKASKTSPAQRATLLFEHAQNLGLSEGWIAMGGWKNRLKLGSHEDGLGVGAWVILSAPSKAMERVGRIIAWNWSVQQSLFVQVEVWEGQWRPNSSTSG